MTDTNKLFNPIFLKEKEIQKIIELLFLSYRDFEGGPDKILAKNHFGRVHYKIIYFIKKHKETTIKELLKILQITKQNLSSILTQLVKKKYINMTVGNDKRTKNLTLTKKGNELEKEISDIQITKLIKILKRADENDINGFKKILLEMISSDGIKIFNKLNE